MAAKQADDDGVYRIVMIGKTGHGKSSTGNTILSAMRVDPSRYFEVGNTLQSQTKRCQWRDGNCFGKYLEVVDTPGFFDTDEEEATVKKEVAKALAIVSPGPHALLLVLRRDIRFTKEEADCVQVMKEYFGENIMHHVIIVLTHSDRIEKQEELSDFLRDCPASFRKIVQEVCNRVIFFNNLEKNQDKIDGKVEHLLSVIEAMMSTIHHQPFSNPLLQRCEQDVVRKSTEIADHLNMTMGKQHRDMVRAGMESQERAEEVLHEILDKQVLEQEAVRTAVTKAAQLQNELETRLSKWQNEKKMIEEEKAKIASDKAQVEAEKAQVEAEKAQVEAEKARLEADKARLEAEKTQLEDVNARLGAVNTRLQDNTEELNEQILGMSVNYEALDQENKKLKNRWCTLL